MDYSEIGNESESIEKHYNSKEAYVKKKSKSEISQFQNVIKLSKLNTKTSNNLQSTNPNTDDHFIKLINVDNCISGNTKEKIINIGTSFAK